MARVASRGVTSAAILNHHNSGGSGTNSGAQTPTRTSSSRTLLSPSSISAADSLPSPLPLPLPLPATHHHRRDSRNNATMSSGIGAYGNIGTAELGWESPQVPGSPLPNAAIHTDTNATFGVRQRGMSASNASTPLGSNSNGNNSAVIAAAAGVTPIITSPAGIYVRTLSSPSAVATLSHSGVATTTGAVLLKSGFGHDVKPMPVSNSTLSSFDVRRLPSHAPVDADGNIINVNELHTDNFNFARHDDIDVSNLNMLERTHLFLHGYLGRWSIVTMHTILVIILVNITAFILSSDHAITHAVGHRVFNIVEAFSVGVFSVEHVLRVWSCIGDPEFRVHGAFWGRVRYSLSFHGVIDFLAIIPYYIHQVLPIKLSFTSALRVLRFFRLLKFDNYTRAFGILKSVFVKEKELLLISGFYCFVALVIGASLLYATDSDVPEFVTIPAAMYSVFCIFMGTFPESHVSTLSKVIIVVMGSAGLTLISVPTGIIASSFVDSMNERREARERLWKEREQQDQVQNEELAILRAKEQQLAADQAATSAAVAALAHEFHHQHKLQQHQNQQNNVVINGHHNNNNSSNDNGNEYTIYEDDRERDRSFDEKSALITRTSHASNSNSNGSGNGGISSTSSSHATHSVSSLPTTPSTPLPLPLASGIAAQSTTTVTGVLHDSNIGNNGTGNGLCQRCPHCGRGVMATVALSRAD